MAWRDFEDHRPDIHPDAWVDESALVIGDVQIGAGSSIWPGAVVRGDIHRIRIGRLTNIQDGCVLHVTHDSGHAPGGHPLTIGDAVTVGHRAVLHGCTVEDACLIGSGAVVLDGAVVAGGALVAAGALVPPGHRLEGGWIWAGNPARRLRALSAAETARIRHSAEYYCELKDRHRSGGRG